MPHPLQDYTLRGRWPVLLSSAALAAGGLHFAGRSPAVALAIGLWLGYCIGYGGLALVAGRPPRGAMGLAACVLATVAVGWALGLLMEHGLQPQPWHPSGVALHLGFQSLMLGVPVLQGASRTRAWHRAERERLRVVAELQSLQAQIEPHFLFNTLAVLRSLVRQRADDALPLLDHITAFLQAVLPDVRRAESTIERELQIVEEYLAIMAIRLGGRLQFSVEAEASTLSLPVSPLLLQPLVENAVRHGVEPSELGGRIDVVVKRDGARCVLDVLNTGRPLCPPCEASGGHGVALDNLRRRLAALHGDGGRAGFSLESLNDGRTLARLILPAI